MLFFYAVYIHNPVCLYNIMPNFDKNLFFTGGPNGRLACMTVNWRADNKARLILAHGYSASASMSEHAKLFSKLAEEAAKIDIGTFMFDFSGNGLSDGYFNEMSPNKRIAELTAIIDHVRSEYKGPLFLLGLSMGGAVSIHTAVQRQDVLQGLITWSAVPSFDPAAASAHWYPASPDAGFTESPGDIFYKDRPAISVADAYAKLTLPKLQIQGDQDFEHFEREYSAFYPSASEPKKHIVLPGGDHVFTRADHRAKVIEHTLAWIEAA